MCRSSAHIYIYAAVDAKTPPWAVCTVPRCFFASETLPTVVGGLHVSSIDFDHLALARSSPAGSGSGTAKLAAVGSHIPHEMGYGHWTVSHILANSTRMEFSDGRVATQTISNLDPRKTTTVALYVIP